MMLWSVRHLWPSGARFVFNCYRHWSTLVVRGYSGTDSAFLSSREGVTQGDPLSMIVYGLGTLPLIRQLRAEFPEVEQPWYADDGGAAGHFTSILRLFGRLQEIGPRFGYFPEPSKCVVIVSPDNVKAATEAFAKVGFQVATGRRYLGGFIGKRDELQSWLASKTEAWTEVVDALSKFAVRYPQAAYAAMQKCLQQQWQFVQRVIEDTDESFAPLETALAERFLPALFGTDLEEDTHLRALSSLPIKWSGLALPNPVHSGASNYEASTQMCQHLLDASARMAFHSALLSTAPLYLTLVRKHELTTVSLMTLPWRTLYATFRNPYGVQFFVVSPQANGCRCYPLRLVARCSRLGNFGIPFICGMAALRLTFHRLVMAVDSPFLSATVWRV